MRLKYDQFEVEGRNMNEIEQLLKRAISFASKIKPARAEQSNESIPGERRKKFIQYPKGKFTIEDLAKESGFSKACIGQRLKVMLENGDAKMLGGWPRVWQVINFPTNESHESPKNGKSFEVDLEDVPE